METVSSSWIKKKYLERLDSNCVETPLDGGGGSEAGQWLFWELNAFSIISLLSPLPVLVFKT